MASKVPTLEELVEDGWDEDDIANLEGYMDEMASCRRKIDEVEEEFKKARENAKSVLEDLGISNAKVPGVGTLSYKEPTTRTTFSKDKIKQAMVGSGIPPAKVNRIMKKAATVSEVPDTVSFRIDKS